LAKVTGDKATIAEDPNANQTGVQVFDFFALISEVNIVISPFDLCVAIYMSFNFIYF
jgi:hypothetical protein